MQADLADRDFTAERHQAVVISMGAVDPIAAETSAAERVAAESRNQHKLVIPRRPAWDTSTTPEQLEAQEKQSFLEWRRYVLLLAYGMGSGLSHLHDSLKKCMLLTGSATSKAPLDWLQKHHWLHQHTGESAGLNRVSRSVV
jgi:hypothetical protein